MKEFNEAMFKTKVDNIFVKILSAIMKQDLSEVRHFMNDELYNKLNDKVEKLKSSGQRQMYDELNVKDTSVYNRHIENNKEVISAIIDSRYMDYVIDMNTGNLLKGDDTRRIERRYYLQFEKNLSTKEIGLVRKCPGCGASISVNSSGKCEYCGSIFNQEDYDYVLVSLS